MVRVGAGGARTLPPSGGAGAPPGAARRPRGRTGAIDVPRRLPRILPSMRVSSALRRAARLGAATASGLAALTVVPPAAAQRRAIPAPVARDTVPRARVTTTIDSVVVTDEDLLEPCIRVWESGDTLRVILPGPPELQASRQSAGPARPRLCTLSADTLAVLFAGDAIYRLVPAASGRLRRGEVATAATAAQLRTMRRLHREASARDPFEGLLTPAHPGPHPPPRSP